MALWLPPGELGKEVRRIRESTGMSQAAFAEALGMKLPGGQTIVSRWEKGRGVSDESLAKIAELADVPIEVFQTEAPHPGSAITTQEIVQLRERMRAIRAETDEVLAVLDEALAGGEREERRSAELADPSAFIPAPRPSEQKRRKAE